MKEHQDQGHRLLRQDDARCNANGLVCIECQDWHKVLVQVWEEDPELSALQVPEAVFTEHDFTWRAPRGLNEDEDVPPVVTE